MRPSTQPHAAAGRTGSLQCVRAIDYAPPDLAGTKRADATRRCGYTAAQSSGQLPSRCVPWAKPAASRGLLAMPVNFEWPCTGRMSQGCSGGLVVCVGGRGGIHRVQGQHVIN
eukprot:208291-Chlamydomonas_euryale.AAC.2